MHQNLSILSPFIAGSIAGSGQQGAADLGGLAGLFGMGDSGQTGTVSFNAQLALVMKSVNGAPMNGDLMNGNALSGFTVNASGAGQFMEGKSLPLSLLQNGPMSGKGVMLAALKGGMNLANLDSDLAASIRNQILTAAQNGEISLPPAWTNALERGAVIHPVFGEEAPDPAELTDIMAALGLIAPGETPQPSTSVSEGAGSGLDLASSAIESESFPSSPALQASGNNTTPEPTGTADQSTALQGIAADGQSPNGQALNGQVPNGQAQDGDILTAQAAAGKAPASQTDPAAAATKGLPPSDSPVPQPRYAEASSPAAASQAAAQGSGVKAQGVPGQNASGNGANPDSNGQGGEGNSANGLADNQGQKSPSSSASDRSGHPFIARLETMLADRGLAIGSPLAQTTGLTGTEDDALAQGVSGIQTGLNTNQTTSAATAGGNTPHMTPWSPVAGQVAVQISKQAKEGAQEFTIRLDPPELGRVNIKLDIAHDGKVNAVISVDNEKTLQMLQRDQSQLEQALADAGLQADSGSLNFSMSGNDGNGGDSGMAADSSARQGQSQLTDTTPTESESLAADTLMISDRPLDITV